MNIAAWVVVAAGVLAIVYGIVTSRQVLAADAGTARMQEISGAVQEGAQAYLNRQYRTIAIVGVVIFVILFATLGWRSGVGYLIGSVLSGAAGYIGMNVSVRANVRTAQAARGGLAAGLALAFRSGAVTGMLVVGLGLLGVSLYYFFLRATLPPDNPARSSRRSSRSVSAHRSSRSSRAWAAASSPRAPMSAPISSARSRPAFPRMIPATPP